MPARTWQTILIKRDFTVDKYEGYKKILRERLTERRYAHSLAVADSAVELARRFGADEDRAREAGILHDIMKDTREDEYLQLFEKESIILTRCEANNKKLLHAIAGAAFIRSELGITDEDVINAVRYHTTGRAGMSLLEKVVYIADYISADRDYNGVEDMRRLSRTSLEEAMLFALKFTVCKLAEKEKPICPDSVECYNELITQYRKESI